MDYLNLFEVIDNGTESYITITKSNKKYTDDTFTTYTEAKKFLASLATYRIKAYAEMLEYLENSTEQDI